jgi:hypothetical protein
LEFIAPHSLRACGNIVELEVCPLPYVEEDEGEGFFILSTLRFPLSTLFSNSLTNPRFGVITILELILMLAEERRIRE